MLNPQFAPDRASPYSREGWHPTFNHHSGTSCRVAGVARYAPTEDHSVDNARRSRKGVACSAPTDAPTTEFQSLLWAEAKRGIVGDIYKPLVQLVLTIGRARTFDTYLPPPFLGVFDARKEFGAITMRSPRQTPTLRTTTFARTFRGETRTTRLSARTPILRLGSHSAFPVATKWRATQDRSGRQMARTTPYTPNATGIANAKNEGRARPQPPLRAS